VDFPPRLAGLAFTTSCAVTFLPFSGITIVVAEIGRELEEEYFQSGQAKRYKSQQDVAYPKTIRLKE
jgi:hypothetical protein